jgi:hypothetical protein
MRAFMFNKLTKLLILGSYKSVARENHYRFLVTRPSALLPGTPLFLWLMGFAGNIP